MKKSVFFKSAFILLVGSLITKLLGFFIRIVFTRIIGEDGINLYSLVMPTYSLVVALTQLGLPIAISTVVARGVYRGKKIVLSVMPFVLAINVLMMVSLTFLSKYISYNLLDNKDAYFPILAMSFSLPFISISSILRGYFFGKQKMMPSVVSNIIEQLVRLLLIVTLLPKFVQMGTIAGVSSFILLSIISEVTSIVVFMFYLPKKIMLNKSDFKPDAGAYREVLGICAPSVGGRIIGNIGYFLEPVILMYVLKLAGYDSNFIVSEYGAYNSYAIPLLMIPSFIVGAISTALLPEVSKNYERGNNSKIKKRLKQSLLISLFIGLITNTFVFLFPEYILKVVYDTGRGADYIRVLAFFFVLYNLEGPLSSTLQAIGKIKEAFASTTMGVIIKTISIAIFSLFHIGLYGLVIGEILDILVIVFRNYHLVRKSILSA